MAPAAVWSSCQQDLCATALGTLGLLLLPLSMWQLLRGSVIVFVALMKRFLLGDHLASREWAGVLIVTLAITLVGLVGAADMKGDRGLGDTLAGVLLTLGGTFVSSLQFAVEEKVCGCASSLAAVAASTLRSSSTACPPARRSHCGRWSRGPPIESRRRSS